jgi:hypothetical protein
MRLQPTFGRFTDPPTALLGIACPEADRGLKLLGPHLDCFLGREQMNHPNPEELELLALGRMAPAKRASIKRHLGRCARCAKSFQETKDYVAAMQAALRKLQDRSNG